MVTNLVGNRIRELRAKRKITQQQLAELADIPRATLATIEKDDSNPSLAAVHKIAVALDCTIDDLLETQQERVELIPREKMGTVESGKGQYQATTVSPVSCPELLQQVFTLSGESLVQGKPHPPGSEEYLHILEGEVILDVGGEKAHLRQGDSAHFRGNVKHSYQNPGKRNARGMVTILTYPEVR
jgi:transcriptional regulator with XRE-family HTH domain